LPGRRCFLVYGRGWGMSIRAKTIRTASFDGAEVTLWVNNRLADHWLARQLRPEHRTRRQSVGAAVQGHERPPAALKNREHFRCRPHVKLVTDLPIGP